ncbi:MAG: PorV/PorQ family protein, partial [Candidatus Goldiibacteriota bacterium]
IVSIVISAVICSMIGASTPSDNSTISFVNINPGGRSAGLAGAYTSIADTESISYNPGALGQLNRAGLILSYTAWNLNTNYQYLMADLPLPLGTIGIDGFYSDMGTIDGMDAFGNPNGQVLKAYATGGTLAYGAMVNQSLSAGADVKMACQSLAGSGVTGIYVDGGLFYHINDSWNAGLSFNNFAFNDESTAQLSASGGASYTTVFDANSKLLASADIKYLFSSGTSCAIGCEYTAFNVASIRAGYNIRGENQDLGGISGLSLGVGVNVSGMKLDYAAVSYGDMGFNHTVSLSFQFEAVSRTTTAAPAPAADNSAYQRLLNALVDQYVTEVQEYKEEGDYTKVLKKLESLKALMPDYEGIDDKIAEAKKSLEKGEEGKMEEGYFNSGMDYYVTGKYDEAGIKWNEVKKLNPAFPAIDNWINTAADMKAGREKSSRAEKCFIDGMKLYNKCMYVEALAKWNLCSDAGLPDDRLTYFRKKCMEMSDKIDMKAGEAETFFNKGNIMEGVKKVRVILTLCPVNEFALGKLRQFKGNIKKQADYLYTEGMDKYASRQIIEAIMDWEKVIEIDPDGNTAAKAKENIEKAREKIKNIEMLKN